MYQIHNIQYKSFDLVNDLSHKILFFQANFRNIENIWGYKNGNLQCKHVCLYNTFFSCVIRVMVFNATFNNISVISWQVYWWKNHQPITSRTNFITEYCIEYTPTWVGFEHTLLVIGTDYSGSCKSMTASTCLLINITSSMRMIWFYEYIFSVEFQINKYKAEELKTLHRVLFGKVAAVSRLIWYIYFLFICN